MPAFAIGGLAVIVLAGCSRGGESAAEAASLTADFPVASPEVKSIVIKREYVADIRAARHAELRARFQGILEAVSVDEGQRVKAGETLFTINARARQQDLLVARAATRGAEAELQAAQLELENTQLLADNNVVSSAELARARSKVEMARAKLEQARATTARHAVELDRAQIRAPFDGVINRVPRKAGSAVGEGEMLTTIADSTEIVAYFAVSEREYLTYRSSQAAGGLRPAWLELADGSVFAHEGRVDSEGSEIDADTGTLTYRARFPNPEGTLKHGSSGKVILETTLPDAVLVPQKATFEIQGAVYVYALDESNVARARKLEIKAQHEDAFAVASGLGPHDRFVVEGLQKVKDGVRVEPRSPTATAPAQPSRLGG